MQDGPLLGGSERLLAHLHARFFGALQIAALFRLSGGLISAERLRSALDRAQARHPKLRARIVDEGRGVYRYALGAPPIPLRVQRLGDERDQWQLLARQLVTEPFPPEGPLMRVDVLNHPCGTRADLILGLHHAIVDLDSLIALADELLADHAGTPRDERPRALHTPSLELPGIGTRLALLGRIAWQARPGRLVLPKQSSRFTLQTLSFDPDRREALRAACRREGATLFGLFAAALAMSVGEGALTLAAPVSLRRFFPELEPADLGCYNTSFSARFTSPGALWPAARALSRAVHRFVERDARPSLAFTAAHTARITRPPPRTTLVVNNFGALRVAPSYGPLRVERFFPAVNVDQVGGDVALLAATLHGRLELNIAAPWLDLPSSEAIAERVRAALARIVDDGRDAHRRLDAGVLRT